MPAVMMFRKFVLQSGDHKQMETFALSEVSDVVLIPKFIAPDSSQGSLHWLVRKAHVYHYQ